MKVSLGLIKKACFALFVVGLGLSPTAAKAQGQAMPLGGSVWLGSESLYNNGVLGFGFNANGSAFMCDARANPNDPRTFLQGSWYQRGNEVEIRFSDCVYRGTINGGQLTGTAQMNQGKPWSFRVAFQPAQPRPVGR